MSGGEEGACLEKLTWRGLSVPRHSFAESAVLSRCRWRARYGRARPSTRLFHGIPRCLQPAVARSIRSKTAKSKPSDKHKHRPYNRPEEARIPGYSARVSRLLIPVQLATVL